MKKILKVIFFVLIALLIIIASSIIINKNSSDIMIELDLLNTSELSASKILYKHFRETSKLLSTMTDSEIETVQLEHVKAFEVDLNNDNRKEIIGVIYSPLTKGKLGYELFVLEEIEKHKYRNLSWSLTFDPSDKVYVSTVKHNGYRNLIVKSSTFFGSQYLIARYENEMYYNEKLTKALMYFMNFSSKTQ